MLESNHFCEDDNNWSLPDAQHARLRLTVGQTVEVDAFSPQEGHSGNRYRCCASEEKL